MWDFWSQKNVGCGIYGAKICEMWDFWGQNMWDVGFLKQCGMWDFYSKTPPKSSTGHRKYSKN